MDDGDLGRYAGYIVGGAGVFIPLALKLRSIFKFSERQITHDANRDLWEARDLARDKAQTDRIVALEKQRDEWWEEKIRLSGENHVQKSELLVCKMQIQHGAELLAVKTAALEGANNEIKLMGQMVTDRDEKIAFLTEQGAQ